MRKLIEITRSIRRQRGSALLVSLMVMVGLSLLGLGFVAVTETESAIAVNERNSAQAQFAAETGARAVVEFFQDTDWADARGLLPKNLTAFKTRREFPGQPAWDGYYKPNALYLLFDKPFKGGDYGNKFYGDGDVTPPTADVWIYYGKNAASTQYLNTLNAALFVPDPAHNETVRISDIRVYAPPIPGETLNAKNFWGESKQSRYGVATVKVTAQKVVGACPAWNSASCRVVAERAVKTVVAETPFPTVDGAIETSGTLIGQGSFEVYWGKVLSEKGIELKRAVAGMPWLDAKNTMQFEYGYDSARERVNSKTYAAGDIVTAPSAALLADPLLNKFAYKATTAGQVPAAEPLVTDWPQSIGLTFNDGPVTWQTVHSKPFPIDADFYHSADWFYQMVARNIPDPWLHARARQEVVTMPGNAVPCGNAAAPHPCKYDSATDDVQNLFSNLFQFQNTTDAGDRPDRVEAVFPTMDYEFWKNVAMSGNNENGVYYFRYATPTSGAGSGHNEFIGPGGQRKSIYYWLNAMQNKLGPGFYFFDSKNSKNPQFGKGGILTPDIKLNSGSTVSPFRMEGYIYLNAEEFGSTGANGPDDVFPMPGEPFRDVGFREVIAGATATPYKYLIQGGAGTLPTGDYVWTGRNNGVWDFQDINENGKFELYLEEKTVTRPDGNPANQVWLPVPFYEDCNPWDNQGPAPVNPCSEPHEPYLNMTYTAAFSGKNPTTGVTIEWYDPSISAAATVQQYRKPKMRTGQNTTVTCLQFSPANECTSNIYDADGGLAKLDALLWGALYSEGGYDGSGNVVYYGALLMRTSFSATGTPTVYFNECLARGCLEDQLKLQRVTVTSWQTD